MKITYLNLLSILFIPLVFFIISCGEKKNTITENEVVFCDAENISADSIMITPPTKFWTSTFKGGQIVSDEQAKSGRSSVKLSGKNQFGMTYLINNVNSGDKFQAEVWRLGTEGAIVFSARNSQIFYKAQKDANKKDDFGWEKLKLNITAPEGISNGELLVYVWNPNKDVPVYFDNLKITYIKE